MLPVDETIENVLFLANFHVFISYVEFQPVGAAILNFSILGYFEEIRRMAYSNFQYIELPLKILYEINYHNFEIF